MGCSVAVAFLDELFRRRSCRIGLVDVDEDEASKLCAELELRMGSGLTMLPALHKRLCGHCEMGFGSTPLLLPPRPWWADIKSANDWMLNVGVIPVTLLFPPGVEWLAGCSSCSLDWLNCACALLSICIMSTLLLALLLLLALDDDSSMVLDEKRSWLSERVEMMGEGSLVVSLGVDLRSEEAAAAAAEAVFDLVWSRLERRSLACSVRLNNKSTKFTVTNKNQRSEYRLIRETLLKC